MAVRLFTKNASALLGAIKTAIDEGHIDTWAYDDVGDFTHTTHERQWERRAWLRPSIRNGRLLLNIIFATGEKQQREVYGVYHGRFIEMAIIHVSKFFDPGAATANMTKEDKELNS